LPVTKIIVPRLAYINSFIMFDLHDKVSVKNTKSPEIINSL